MSLKQIDNSNNDKTPSETLVCNAPKITIKPIQKKIPPINVIEDSDSSFSEEQKEKQKIKIKECKKDSEDDSYEDSDDSFDEDFFAERETQSQSANIKCDLKKFKEENPESL